MSTRLFFSVLVAPGLPDAAAWVVDIADHCSDDQH